MTPRQHQGTPHSGRFWLRLSHDCAYHHAATITSAGEDMRKWQNMGWYSGPALTALLVTASGGKRLVVVDFASNASLVCDRNGSCCHILRRACPHTFFLHARVLQLALSVATGSAGNVPRRTAIAKDYGLRTKVSFE